MNNITYIEAWKLWLAGESTNQFYLLGLRILWWGRFGKIVGLLAGLVVISEIIGSESLLRWSSNLQTTIDIKITAEALIKQFNSTISDMKKRSIIPLISGRLINYVFKAKKSKAINIALTIATIYIFFSGSWLGSYLLLAVLFDFLGSFLWKIVTPIFVLLYKLVIAIPVYIVDNIAHYIANLLAFFANERYTKAISVALLIIGFHFDLLAS